MMKKTITIALCTIFFSGYGQLKIGKNPKSLRPNAIFQVETNNSRNFIIDTFGNVGIGQNNPIVKLEVNGNQGIRISTVDTGLQTMLEMYSTISTGSVSDWKLYKSDGKTGYAQGLHLYSYPKNGSSFGGCCNHRLTILDNGNMGIGQGLPTSRLEIQGDIKITDGTEGAGKVLTSDANGKASWQSISTSANTIGDIKMGLQTTDHSGWIKLDGRAVNTLTSSQRAAALTLGFSLNLPNATNAFPVQNGTTLGTVSSSNAKTIIRSNLPNVVLNATTSAAGAHSHTLSLPNRPGYSSYNGITSFLGGDANVGPSTATTSSTGDHTHSISINLNGGVTQQNLDVTPSSFSVNMFLYLGN